MATPSGLDMSPDFKGSDVVIKTDTNGLTEKVPRNLINCIPVAVTPNSTPSGGAYTATCSNYPDFAISYTDKNDTLQYCYGMKVRVIFTKGITYGSTSATPATYPTLNINSTGNIPLLAQGMTMGAGAAAEGQTLELTLIPWNNGLAWDADSNVRENSEKGLVYVDGTRHVSVNFTNSSATAIYKKISGLVVSGQENVFLIQARGGDLFIMSAGHGDNQVNVAPKIKRLIENYNKIQGFSYNNTDIIVKVGSYSHQIVFTRIAGTKISDVTVSDSSESEYNSGTILTIEN